MKFFFVTYCFGRSWGESLIGVYKRGLRIAMKLHERGHEIVFFCGGRENFQDAMTDRAQELFEFVDDPFTFLVTDDAEETRERGKAGLLEIDPDVVVIGEAPLKGLLLEASLCTAELGIPMVCIDNTYAPELVELFWDHQGALFDHIVLSGPSSFWAPNAPDYVAQFPLFIETAPEEARALVESELELPSERLLTVLGYDETVEGLGIALFAALADPQLTAVIVTHEVDASRERLAVLPADLRESIRVVSALSDPLLFGLLEISHLAVGKCGFMQIAESLSLGTPIITYRPPRGFYLPHLPKGCHDFAIYTEIPEPTPELVAIARRLLALAPEEMPRFHEGGFGAAERVAAHLESLGNVPRRDLSAEAAAQGLTEERILRPLRALHPEGELEIVETRLVTLRVLDNNVLGFEEKGRLALCRYRHNGEERFERLWIRSFPSEEMTEAYARATREAIAEAGEDTPLYESDRQIYEVNRPVRYVVERYTGDAMLPPL